MASLDLKPLSNETIAEMKFTPNELWMVTIDKELFGPFETESLKHYASENKDLFTEALATKVDQQDWQAFFAHPELQRRGLSLIQNPKHEGPYWLLDHGQKSQQLTKTEIEKRLEMGTLSLRDAVSNDDGHTWKKLFQVEAFEKRTHSVDDLPMVLPPETSFQKAKLAVAEKMESSTDQTFKHEGLASLVFIDQHREKPLALKLEEITVATVQEVSSSLKWAIPTAVAGAFALVMGGIYLLTPTVPYNQIAVSSDGSNKEVILPSGPQALNQQLNNSLGRRPASVAPLRHQRSALTQPGLVHDSNYPTIMETHSNNDRFPSNEPDPLMDAVQEVEQPVQENSLVDLPQDTSLDASMNAPEAPPEQPVMEESSDF